MIIYLKREWLRSELDKMIKVAALSTPNFKHCIYYPNEVLAAMTILTGGQAYILGGNIYRLFHEK